eukprot:CCRYP_004573-RA/>CCRYP_004573-RA protein AED:0.13 eAED:0.13 QI:288/1/1/1/0/0/2/635/899
MASIPPSQARNRARAKFMPMFRPTQAFTSCLGEASRASIVALVTITLLLLPGEDILPSPWLGSVLAMSALKPTLGDTILATSSLFVPLVPVSIVGYAVSIILDTLDTLLYSILLPFVVIAGTLFIMLCPWPFLTSKNLMLVVFYLMIASPLSLRTRDPSALYQEVERPEWFLASFLGTAMTGFCVSLGVHCVLLMTPASTSATRTSLELMNQMSHQTYNLLNGVSLYTNNLGRDIESVMKARGLIEFYITRRKETLGALSSLLSAVQAESNIVKLKSFLCNHTQKCCVDSMKKFVQCAEKQQHHADMIHIASTNVFLGEELTVNNESVKDLKTRISHHLGNAIEQLALEFQRTEKIYFFTNQGHRENPVDALQSSLGNYVFAMRNAIQDADALTTLLERNVKSSARSLSGPKIRSRVIFHAVYSLVHELVDMMAAEKEENVQSEASPSTFMQLKSNLKMPWLHGDIVKRRLALKTSLALGLASLWVSIPYLREEIAYPNGIWVGITVAIVSLDNTGASYMKCVDRLWGTLIAAAYALLISKMLPYDITFVRIISYFVFTFVATLLKDPQRPYMSQCSVNGVASILFGSVYNKVVIHEYVTQRIMLIFVGVATFLLVELAVYPRSSRAIVQSCALKFFDELQCFLVDAFKTCESISTFQCQECEVPDQIKEDPLFMLRRGHEEMSSYTSCLSDGLSKLKEIVTQANHELLPGVAEPSLGLRIKLHAIGYEQLFRKQEQCISQLELLVTCVNSLLGYYSFLPGHEPVRALQWPSLLAAIIHQVSQQLQVCINCCKVVFPRGLCEPGSGSVSNMIVAISGFRSFEVVRLSILTKSIADRHADNFNMLIASGNEISYPPGFRITVALALSSVLTVAQGLQVCGLHIEEIVRAFPLEKTELADH